MYQFYSNCNYNFEFIHITGKQIINGSNFNCNNAWLTAYNSRSLDVSNNSTLVIRRFWRVFIFILKYEFNNWCRV